MKAVIYLLRNNSTLVNLLTAARSGNKADAIYIGHGEQGQEAPYISIEDNTEDNFLVKDQRQTLVKKSYTVNVYARTYATLEAVADQVAATLDRPTPGTYNGQVLSSCVLKSEDTINDIQPNNEYWMKMMSFEAMLEDGTNVTELTAASYSNNNQTIQTGQTMTAMAMTLTPSNATVTYEVISGSLPTNATLNTTTGAITQSAAAAADVYAWTVKVQAYGSYVGVIYVQCSLEVATPAVCDDATANINVNSVAEGSVVIPSGDTETIDVNITDGSNPVTPDNVTLTGNTLEIQVPAATIAMQALNYPNNNQTVWVGTADAQGKGAPASMTPDNQFETGTYAILVSTPAGVSINASTGVITYTFASLGSGATTFTVRKTGTGDYTGTSDFVVTITKRTRWLPTDVGALETATLRTDASWNLYKDNGAITESGGEVSAITNFAGTTWTQGTVGRRAQLTTMDNGREVPSSIFTKVYSGSLASNFATNFSVLFSAMLHKTARDNSILATSLINFIGLNGSTNSFRIQVNGGTSVNHTPTEAQWAKMQGRHVVVLIKYKTGAHKLEVYDADETIFTGTNTLVEANAFQTTNLCLMSRSTTAQDPLWGALDELITIENDASVADESNLIAHLKYNAGLATLPPFV